MRALAYMIVCRGVSILWRDGTGDHMPYVKPILLFLFLGILVGIALWYYEKIG